MRPRYNIKEISWLSFNERVLQEAANPNVPLIERIKFLGIFSSNLDEFYRVRVATLQNLTKLGDNAKKIIGHDPRKTLKRIKKIVLKLDAQVDETYARIVKDLAAKRIYLLNEDQLNAKQQEFVSAYFRDKVHPNLFPVMINPEYKFPELKDKSIYLLVIMRNSRNQRRQHALIEVPTGTCPRFVQLPSERNKNYIIYLDDVIRYSLGDIFSMFDYDQFEAYTIKLTRNAEMDIDDDYSESMLRKINKGVKRRKEGYPVRFIYDRNLPPKTLALIRREFGITKNDTVIPGARYHNFKDMFSFPNIGPPGLQYKDLPPVDHPDLAGVRSLFDVIRQKDVLLHFPYHSFDYFIDLLREAAIDPHVTSIKVTVYRAAKNSSVMNALINAVKNGKDVTVVLELQARFDEVANIRWADKLREEGVCVRYGILGLKIHAKICHVLRQEGAKEMEYAAVGTGNFNEDTATLYTDHILMTSDARIAHEVGHVFEFLESTYKQKRFDHLIVSPFMQRNCMMKLIDREMEHKAAGNPCGIDIKLNNLDDREVIDKLYEASTAGVPIRLMIRGMFSLIPGIPGTSDNIQAIGVVDRFLEHSRILIFRNGGDEEYFISSADWMGRNFDKRVEVACPVYDPLLRRELKDYMEIQFRDNVKARILNESLDNQFRRNRFQKKIRSQYDLYEYFRQETEAKSKKGET